jgi:predicted nucleic acid-binding protein
MSAGAVVDSWALLAYLLDEVPASTAVSRYLTRAHAGNMRLVLSWINYGEVFYRVVRRLGEARGEEAMAQARRLPIELAPVRDHVVLEAARLKAAHAISYADAFAVATARLQGLPLLTGDPEILALPGDVVRVRRLDRWPRGKSNA